VTANEVWAIARRRLQELGCAVPESISFVDDRQVRYDIPDRICVSRSDLFEIGDGQQWRTYLDPPATWLHFNLLTVADGPTVVTVRRSPQSLAEDDPRSPPVNVSVEPTPARLDST
jgi:hypothetical protein